MDAEEKRVERPEVRLTGRDLAGDGGAYVEVCCGAVARTGPGDGSATAEACCGVGDSGATVEMSCGAVARMSAGDGGATAEGCHTENVPFALVAGE